MAALSGEQSCRDGHRAKKAGLAISGLQEVRGSLSKIIDSPSAFLGKMQNHLRERVVFVLAS